MDIKIQESGLYAIKAEGSGLRTIIDFGGTSVQTAWSPDGSMIAVRGNFPDGSGSGLYTVASDGSDSRILVRGGRGLLVAENSDWEDVTDDIAACEEGFVVPDPSENQGLVQDCETLLSIRNALAGENVVLGWSVNTPISEWPGVGQWGEPVRVRGLTLRPYVAGSFPPGIGMLSELEELRIGSSLTGPIPPELGDLTKLRLVQLESNQLTGEIPAELGKLNGLESLNLERNKLTGEIPPELGSLPNLEYLNVDTNRLTGCVPTELLERRPSLTILHEGLEPC